MRAVTRRMTALAALGVLAAAAMAGCGGASSPSDAAAKQFVSAVTRDDRVSWCGQVGEALLVSHRAGGLVRQLLTQCKNSDLFAVLGDCDREAVIYGTSVTGDSTSGNSAKVRLSSGATLGLTQDQGKWFITAVSGGSPQHIKQGQCAGAGGA